MAQWSRGKILALGVSECKGSRVRIPVEPFLGRLAIRYIAYFFAQLRRCVSSNSQRSITTERCCSALASARAPMLMAAQVKTLEETFP